MSANSTMCLTDVFLIVLVKTVSLIFLEQFKWTVKKKKEKKEKENQWTKK